MRSPGGFPLRSSLLTLLLVGCAGTNSPPSSLAPPSPSQGECTNSCLYSSDADCDDGGPGAEYESCQLSTDCDDCGPRVYDERCQSNACSYSVRRCPQAPSALSKRSRLITHPCRTPQHDGKCDDGGPGAEYYACTYGSDCEDCTGDIHAVLRVTRAIIPTLFCCCCCGAPSPRSCPPATHAHRSRPPRVCPTRHSRARGPHHPAEATPSTLRRPHHAHIVPAERGCSARRRLPGRRASECCARGAWPPGAGAAGGGRRACPRHAASRARHGGTSGAHRAATRRCLRCSKIDQSSSREIRNYYFGSVCQLHVLTKSSMVVSSVVSSSVFE